MLLDERRVVRPGVQRKSDTVMDRRCSKVVAVMPRI